MEVALRKCFPADTGSNEGLRTRSPGSGTAGTAATASPRREANRSLLTAPARRLGEARPDLQAGGADETPSIIFEHERSRIFHGGAPPAGGPHTLQQPVRAAGRRL